MVTVVDPAGNVLNVNSAVSFLLDGNALNLCCSVGLEELVSNVDCCERAFEIPDVVLLVVVARSNNITNRVNVPVCTACVAPGACAVSDVAGKD